MTETKEIVTGLSPGVTYKFKVRARNIVNYGQYSSALQVLAAQIPDKPATLSNVASITNAGQIGLVWEAPLFDGGSPVLDYRLWWDDSQFSQLYILGDELTVFEFTVTGLV